MDLILELSGILGGLAATIVVGQWLWRKIVHNPNTAANVEAQAGLIETLQAELRIVKQRLDEALATIERQSKKIDDLQAVVTSRREIEALHRDENKHHAETIAVLSQIKEAVSGHTAA